MNLLTTLSVLPILPERLGRLRELAHNLWWSWTPEAVALFAELGGALWDELEHNPVHMLAVISQQRLEEKATDEGFVKRLQGVLKAFDAYMKPRSTWYTKHHGAAKKACIAYFSAEFGLHECLPIYSGGLGILSGDHCKSASDLGLPFVGVGLLYNQGYFRQLISSKGNQEAVYERLKFSLLPISEARDASGEPVVIAVEMPDRTLHAKVWKVQVGRIPVYLLDTDIPSNSSEDRRLSSQLYGGDRDMRISQEIILGIGGIIALQALGLEPTVCHMNEGHSAFLSLARIRERMHRDGLSFAAALEATAGGAVFTTHTPVPAGHDAFSYEMMERYFARFNASIGLSLHRLLALGQAPNERHPSFSMTVLALQGSRHANGVSKLHGVVSRELWRDMWPGFSDAEQPIGHITNGVHTASWMAPELQRALDQASKGTTWRDNPRDPQGWTAPLDAIPNEQLWNLHMQLKNQMLDCVRERVRRRRVRLGRSNSNIRAASTLLDPKALTIGFARRFATYKRATLLFEDLERMARILHDIERPVQILFAGKAHPADEPGKDFIRKLYELSRESEFLGKVIVVEGYDINLARHLVSGVDLWLNNPRRPLEACGTSGQKAAMNGVINCSVLDGWWDEGYNGDNGWTVGERRNYTNLDEQDEADASSLYDVLETEIIPLYFDRDAKGVPQGWVRKMKESMASAGPAFNTHRMLADYTEELYLPAHHRTMHLAADDFAAARRLTEWKDRVRTLWHQVHLEAQAPQASEAHVGETLHFRAEAHLGNLDVDDVAVELFVVETVDGELGTPQVIDMKPSRKRAGQHGGVVYEASYTLVSNGNYSFGVRAVPSHSDLTHRREMGLVCWAETGDDDER